MDRQGRALVDDRIATQFVGSPETVAKHLRVLREVTGANELLVTAITYRHEDRVRSYELLAREWGLALPQLAGHDVFERDGL